MGYALPHQGRGQFSKGSGNLLHDMPEPAPATREKPIGVIDALSIGYRLLLRRPYVAAVPFLVDMFFWLGPRVTPWEAFRTLLRQADPELRTLVERATGLDMLTAGQSMDGPNLLTGLVQGPGAPGSLAAALGTLPAPPGWEVLTLSPASPWLLIGLVVALIVIGTPLAAFYMTLAVHALVRERVLILPYMLRPSDTGITPNGVERFPFWLVWIWTTGNLLVLVVLIVLFFVASIIGLSLMAVVSMFVSPALSVGIIGVGTIFMSWLMLMGMLFFYFTPASIVVHHSNALQGMARSARVVYRYLWSCIGLVLISMVITEGFALIWRSFFTNIPGMIISIAGNALLTSGLTLGTIIFFVDRSGWMSRERSE